MEKTVLPADVGPDGGEDDQLVSEGGARGFERDDGMVHLSGVRQDEDFNQLLFNIVRIGDTSESVAISYKIVGLGKGGVGRGDFEDPVLMRGSFTPASIDQPASSFDAAGAGIVRVALDPSADGKLEGAEGFRIVLTSGDVTPGTSIYIGTLFDGDYARVTGTLGDDKALNGSAKADVIDGRDGNDTIAALNGDDIVFGGSGRDRIDGGRGNDWLTGGNQGDRFAFADAAGDDRIADFGAGDVIDLVAYDTRLRDLMIEAAGKGTRITHSGGTIVLEGVDVTSVTAGDFLFG